MRQKEAATAAADVYLAPAEGTFVLNDAADAWLFTAGPLPACLGADPMTAGPRAESAVLPDEETRCDARMYGPIRGQRSI